MKTYRHFFSNSISQLLEVDGYRIDISADFSCTTKKKQLTREEIDKFSNFLEERIKEALQNIDVKDIL